MKTIPIFSHKAKQRPLSYEGVLHNLAYHIYVQQALAEKLHAYRLFTVPVPVTR